MFVDVVCYSSCRTVGAKKALQGRCVRAMTLCCHHCRKKNNVVYMKEHGFAEEMLDGLLNLDLALQCDGFVSSINSNWAR